MACILILVRADGSNREIGTADDLARAEELARRRLLQRDIRPRDRIAIYGDDPSEPVLVVEQT